MSALASRAPVVDPPIATRSAPAPLAHRRLRGVPTGRAKRWQLLALVLLAATGWTLLGEVVVRTNPDEAVNRVLFIATLTLGVFPLGRSSRMPFARRG